MKRPWLALLLLGAALPGWAETLQIPLGSRAMAVPRCLCAATVAARSWNASACPIRSTRRSVGQPIRRWDYRDFSVYFENDGCWMRFANRGARSPHPSAKEPS